jgi:hypothetical protein
MVRRAARVDANHGDIAAAFVAMGCSVRSLAAVGGGVPDLLVAAPGSGHTFLVEVKDGAKSKSRRKLTDAQKEFKDQWKGPIFYVEHSYDVVPIVNAMRRA